jgi:hypothetical protein
MGATVTARSGYNADYPRMQVAASAERSPLGYYSAAAQKGEPEGRWFGAALPELGLAEGQAVDQLTGEEGSAYLAVYSQVNPATGEHLGRAPMTNKNSRDKRYAALKEAEPGATRQRLRQLTVQAKREVRESAPYTDMTVSWSKSLGVFHASLRQNERLAREAGDLAGAAYWAEQERKYQEITAAANRAALDYLERHGGATRTGYHGAKVNGQEQGKWERARLVGTTWQQGTSRDGDPHDHHHNLIARMVQTISDGKWRAVDTMALRRRLPGMQAVATAHVEAELSRVFGVSWVARKDGKGFEIRGVSQEHMDMFSARARDIDARMEARVAQFRAEFAREPTRREMSAMHEDAWDEGREGKDEERIDWDALSARWDAQTGGALAGIAPVVATFPAQPAPVSAPDPEVLARAARQALARVQAAKSTWTRDDLLKYLALSVPPEARAADPEAALEGLADQALAGEFEAVVPMTAPQWPALPAGLVREDGTSVYSRPGTTHYATRVQLSMEEALLQTAQREGAPCLSREEAARLIGADPDALDAILREAAQVARESATGSGLRADQGAALYHVLTSPRLAEVLIGPAGSGKTRTLAEAARAWMAIGGSVLGLATSQAATNVLLEAGVPAAENTSVFLGHMEGQRGARGIRREMPRGSLIVLDEVSMMSTADLHDILLWVARHGHKAVICADHAQLGAVESGGGLDLLVNRAGHVQLAEAVRFREAWEGPASLRLRVHDVTALEEYADRGRIRGGSAADVMADARRLYVSHYVQGTDVRLLTCNQALGRELGRHIRSDLRHLGLVDAEGPEVEIADGQRAGRGDMLRVTDNDHKAGVTNRDILRVEAVNDDGSITVRRAIEHDRDSGQRRWSDDVFRWWGYKQAESGFWQTGHSAQGQTVGVGITVATGSEDAYWLYSAMTRGAIENEVCVVTSAAVSDPVPGAHADPEIARHERVKAERAAQAAPASVTEPGDTPPEALEPRDPLAVLADIAGRHERELSALEMQEQELADAHHLARLGAMWDGETAGLRKARYRQAIVDALPEDAPGALGSGGTATWLWRTMHAAEAAGLDVREVAARALRGRPLDGARNIAAVIDARIRKDCGALIPVRQRSWAEQVPEVADPARQRFLTELAEAMDARKEAIGVHAAETSPRWAVTALGAVPEEPLERLEWTQRASEIGAYRQRFGWEHPTDPVGMEPSGDSPDKRAAWHGAYAAMTRTEDIDLSGDPDSRLHMIRDTYAAETSWAPQYPAARLQAVRTALIDQAALAARSDAEAEAARGRQEEEVAGQHETLATSARALVEFYRVQERIDAGLIEDYQAWSKVTEGSRRLAAIADAELRRRYPDAELGALETAEDESPSAELDELPVIGADVAEITEKARQSRAAFLERLEQRQGVMVPDEDPDVADIAEAWPSPFAEPDRDAILQPPKPLIRPSVQVQRLAAEREAGQ